MVVSRPFDHEGRGRLLPATRRRSLTAAFGSFARVCFISPTSTAARIPNAADDTFSYRQFLTLLVLVLLVARASAVLLDCLPWRTVFRNCRRVCVSLFQLLVSA